MDRGASPQLLLWWCFLSPLVLCCIVTVLGEPSKNEIKVNRETGLDCSTFSNRSLLNQTCNNLQDVLISVSVNGTSHSFGECIEIEVHSGIYKITKQITIHQAVVLRGTWNATVSFSLNDTLYLKGTLYVLSFVNSEYSGINGIDFHTSPGIITFLNVTNVTIQDSSFSFFSQGAVDIYNCPTALVTNCTFEHNGPVSVIKSGKYRGHAGGLSVGYYKDMMLATRPQLRVEKCTFRNNTSDPEANIQLDTTSLLQTLIFTGRGGGCSILMNPIHPLNATIEDCLFEENIARTFGGGLYVIFDGELDHRMVLTRVKLVRNICWESSGGLLVAVGTGSTVGVPSSIRAYNSEFIENEAVSGGGMGFFQLVGKTEGHLSIFAHFENCTFTGNTAEKLGAAMGFQSHPKHVFLIVENTTTIEIENCTFINNDGGKGGTVTTTNVHLRFKGFNLFKANRGRSFMALASWIEVHGTVNFKDNNALGIGGGALYMASGAYLQLFQGANLTFEGNIGVMGAAIVVETHNHLVPRVYSRLLFNTLCFLQYEDKLQPPEKWENISFMFSGNKALVASALFMTNLDLCSWTQFNSNHFAPEKVLRWDFVHFSNYSGYNENTAHERDAYNPEWCIQTPARKINVTTNAVSAYPGEEFRLAVKAFDELDRPTATILRLSEMNGTAHYLFNPSVTTLDQIENTGLNTSFFSLAGANLKESKVLEVFVESVLEENPSWDTFTMVSDSCPPGYILSAEHQSEKNMNTTKCKCDYENPDIVDCNGHSIVLQEGLWATEDSSSKALLSYPCPPQYCQCALGVQGRTVTCRSTFDSKNRDSQCTCDREGELCGNCRNGYGVSVLLNKCVTCPSVSGILIATLICLDAVVLMASMLLLDRFPAWLYPCLFYVQVLPYLAQHFPLTFEKLQPYAYYVSSGLSFYFIYDFCLYAGMSPLVSYLLKYLPLGVALIICSTVLVIRYVYKKPRNPWYGLWWIVLLMYTHVVHTSMSILNCPILPGRSGDHAPHWYINGNVKCFTGDHAPLGLLSIIILAFCVSIIPLPLLYSVGWLQRPGWLRHTVEVMRKGFKEKYKWWATVELGRRVLLLLFIVPFPGNEHPATFILSVVITVFGFLQPYKSMYNNILECLLSLDVLVLLLVRNTKQFSDEQQVLPQQSSNLTTEGTCRNEVEGITGFSWLLFQLYYFPLVVFLIIVAIWTAFTARQYVYTLKRCHSSNTTQLLQEEEVGSIQQSCTVTYLDLETLESEEHSQTDLVSLVSPATL